MAEVPAAHIGNDEATICKEKLLPIVQQYEPQENHVLVYGHACAIFGSWMNEAYKRGVQDRVNWAFWQTGEHIAGPYWYKDRGAVNPFPKPETGIPPVGNRRQIKGVLRTDGDRCFIDDNGPIIPVFNHFGDGFARFTVDPANAEAGVAESAEAGYHGVLSWTILNNTPGNTRAPWHSAPYYYLGPRTTPDYYRKARDYAKLLKSYGLVWFWSCGGIGGDEFPRDAQREMFKDLANMMDEVGPETFVVEVVNELLASSPSEAHSPEYLEPLGDIIRVRHPNNLVVLSALGGVEDPHILEPYNRKTSFLYYHGYRGGNIGNKADHHWTFGYEAAPKIGKRLVWDGEPCGSWSIPFDDDGPEMHGKAKAYVSSQANDGEFDDESAGLIAAKQFIGRGAYTFFCSSGVRYIRPFGLPNFDARRPWYPGFKTIPKLAAMLPQDMHTYEYLMHGGDNRPHSAKRFLGAVGGGRADHLVSADGRGVIAINGENDIHDRSWNYPVLRSFTGKMIDPGTLDVEDVTLHAGDRLNTSYKWGRVLVVKAL